MKQQTERAIWLGIAILAFGGGMMATRHSSPQDSADSAGSAEKSSRSSSRDGREGDQTRPGGKGSGLSPDRAVLAERTALASPLRTGRFQGMAAVLDQITPDNWQAMWQEMRRQTLEDGRIHETEWSLFMGRVGEIAGAEAIAFFGQNGQPEFTFNRREILRGWAAMDPAAAIAWLDAQPADSPNQQIRSALVEGVIQADPEKAIDLLRQNTGDDAARSAASATSELIQSKGIQWTIEKMQALARGQDKPDATVSGMYQTLSERMVRMAWLGEQPDSVVEWFAKDPGLMVQSGAGTSMVRAVAGTQPGRAAELLVQGYEQTGVLDQDGFKSLARTWMSRDPDGFRAWSGSAAVPDALRALYPPGFPGGGGGSPPAAR